MYLIRNFSYIYLNKFSIEIKNYHPSICQIKFKKKFLDTRTALYYSSILKTLKLNEMLPTL